MKISLTAKLVIVSVACVLAVMAVFFLYFYVSETDRLTRRLDDEAQRIRDRVASNLVIPVYQYDDQQIGAVLAQEIGPVDVKGIIIRDPRQAVLAGKIKDADGRAADVPPGADIALTGCYRQPVASIRYIGSGAPQAIGSVELCFTDASLQLALDALVRGLLAQAFWLTVVLCVVIVIALRRILVAPIKVIHSAVAGFEGKDFARRTELDASDELGELGRSFDRMADTISGYSANLERAIAERTQELVRKNEMIALEKEAAEVATQEKTELLNEQATLIRKLEDAQGQLLQSEKMASIGQLAAGVAHEINNPIGFVNSNLGSLKLAVEQLLSLIAEYEKVDALLVSHPALGDAIGEAKRVADLDYLREDMPNLIAESLDGVMRVRRIVDNLKDFSRADAGEWALTDLEKGLESTLTIVWNEIKYKAEVRKEYAGLPPVQCIASQINQVLLNLLVNAAQAIEQRGVITLRTGNDGQFVWIEVEDTGQGIRPEHLPRIFDPFFTTKPVGKGTGLGLSLAYGIMQRHGGRIDVRSTPGQGTVFRVVLPRERVRQEAGGGAETAHPAA